jgi:hypothetical protein
MAKEKRHRAKRNLTLNPDGVDKLFAIGKALPVPEENLSRLVDMAISKFVASFQEIESAKTVANLRKRKI